MRTIRGVHWNCIDKILFEGLEERDSKTFGDTLSSEKKDSVGIAPIKQGGVLHTDANMKATLWINHSSQPLHQRNMHVP